MIAILSALIPIDNRGIVLVYLTLEIIYRVANDSSIRNKITILMTKIVVCIILVARVSIYMSIAIYVIVRFILSLTWSINIVINIS